MSQLNLKLPMLVTQSTHAGQAIYTVRPLFFVAPSTSHRRYEKALALFRREIRQQLRGTPANRTQVERLLWFGFNPSLSYRRLEVKQAIRKQFIQGTFSYAVFQVRGFYFICLPGCESYTFMVPPQDTYNATYLEQCAREKVVAFLAAQKAHVQDERIEIEAYVCPKKESIRVFEDYLSLPQAQWAFEPQQEDAFFSFMQSQHSFDGETELETIGYDLNTYYPQQLHRAKFREPLVQRLYRALYQGQPTPLVLLGPEGVGRHTLLHEAIFRYIDAEEQQRKESHELDKVWHLDPTRLIAGMKLIGMWQKRTEAILRFLINTRQPNDKLFIDQAIALQRIGKTSQNSMTVSDLLKPYLEQRQLQVILIATPEEWKIVQDHDRSFADLFQVMRVAPPTAEEAVRMVLARRRPLEQLYQNEISVQAIEQLFYLHRNYFKQRALPGGVVRMLEQLSSRYRFQNIDIPEVNADFKLISQLNETFFDEAHTFERDELRKQLGAKLVGQPQAVDALANVLHLIKAKLTPPSKPLGSFMFIGPTGVGKTQAAKVLSQYLLGSEKPLMRFDMNEYIDGSAVERLIGDYYHPEGQLTGKVRYNPFGIILFDEIEKAHPKVHDLLLQVLDDGRLSDSLGRTVDFSNTVIIMTSNVGAADIGRQLGFTESAAQDAQIYRRAVEKHFRPEFVNRIDQIVIFQALAVHHILDIAKLQIQELLQRDGFVRRTTILNISPEALEWVARRGYDARMGGRALKRQIERDLTTLSAEQLVRAHHDEAILFTIFLEDGRLKPQIRPLHFLAPQERDWLPHFENEAEQRKFFGRLIKFVESLEKQLKTLENQWLQDDNEGDFRLVHTDTSDNEWYYYHFKDRLREVKERIQRRLLSFGNKYYQEAGNVLRLKSTGTSSIIYKRDSEVFQRKLVQEKLFQESALDELRHVYLYAPSQFDQRQSSYINDFLDVAFLPLGLRGLREDQPVQLQIHIESVIHNLGQEEIEYLQNCYIELCTHLEITCKKEAQKLTLEGYGLIDMFKGEQGLHLFYKAHQNPLPLRVNICYEGAPESPSPTVIRLYDIWRGVQSRSSTLTDLRTTYTNFARIQPQEFKLLLLAGVPDILTANQL